MITQSKGHLTRMKQSQPKLPKAKIVIRLSERDHRLIRAGLNWIVGNYRLSNRGARILTGRVERAWVRSFDPGSYDQDLMDGIIALRVTVVSLAPSGRLRVDTSFEIGACALAVRVVARRCRHGHTRFDMPQVDRASKRLLRRLEVVRKRAKRAEVRRSGLNSYQARAHEWQRFIRWIRVHIPDCGSTRLRRPARFGPPKMIVDKLVSWVRAELMECKQRLPNERELRRLVRLALRYIRRGRRGFSGRYFLEDKVFASAYLANFVTTRLENASSRRTS